MLDPVSHTCVTARRYGEDLLHWCWLCRRSDDGCDRCEVSAYRGAADLRLSIQQMGAVDALVMK